jgi:phytoene/squalene synthetase
LAQLTGGTLAVTDCCILGSRSSETASIIQSIGTAWALVQQLLGMASNLSDGIIYLPLEEMVKSNVTQSDIQQGQVTEPIRELLGLQIQRIRELLSIGKKEIAQLPGDGSRLTGGWWIVSIENQLASVEKHLNEILQNRQIPVRPMGWLSHFRRAWFLK